MKYFKILLNKHFPQKLDPETIKSFKVMMKHVNGKDTTISVGTHEGHDYIISNTKTHYDLIISDDKIQLVNTTDVVDIHVPDVIRTKVLKRVTKNMAKERTERIKLILARKQNTLDKILTQMK